MGASMPAVYVGPEKYLEDFAPGEWTWLEGKKGILFRLPNGHEGAIQAPRWTLTGDGETITASPSIWYRQGQGEAAGEWHGWLQNGQWRSC